MWNFSNAVSVSFKMIIWFISFILLMWQNTLISNVKLTLNSWTKYNWQLY
jgi:hypothetical protein